MMWVFILLFILIVGLLFWTTDCKNVKEKFSGALTQLYARGPQDRYLIGDSAYRYYWTPYYETVWNNPTRIMNRYPMRTYRYIPRYRHVYPLYVSYDRFGYYVF